MATLTWLGTGSAFNAKDGNTASLLKIEDNLILFDCGMTVPYKLKELGLINQVTHVMISHTHSDHAGGLELLAQWRYFVGQRQGFKVPKLIAPRDIMEKLRLNEQLGLGNIQDEFGRPMQATLETYFDVETCGALFLEDERGVNYDVVCIPVEHVPGGFPSYGFEINRFTPTYVTRKAFEKGHIAEMVANASYFLTADTRSVHPSEIKEDRPRSGLGVKAYDLVFHDCQLFCGPCGGAGDVHANIHQLEAQIPQDSRGKVWLTHYGENWKDFEAQAATAGFAGFVRPEMAFEL